MTGHGLSGEPPDADAPVDEVLTYWTDNDSVSMFASLLEGLAAVALIFFAASVCEHLRRTDRRDVLSLAAMGGGIVAAAGIGVDASLRFAAADLVGDVDPIVIQTINAIWSSFFFPMVIGLATLIFALSLAALLGRRLLPMWLAIVGIVLAVIFFTPAGFIALFVGAVWIIVVSVLLWRQDTKEVHTLPVAQP